MPTCLLVFYYKKFDMNTYIHSKNKEKKKEKSNNIATTIIITTSERYKLTIRVEQNKKIGCSCAFCSYKKKKKQQKNKKKKHMKRNERRRYPSRRESLFIMYNNFFWDNDFSLGSVDSTIDNFSYLSDESRPLSYKHLLSNLGHTSTNMHLYISNMLRK